MDGIDRWCIKPERLSEFLKVSRFLSCIEIDPHDGHHVDLALGSPWDIAGEGSHINRLGELHVDELDLVPIKIAEALSQLLFFGWINSTVGLGCLDQCPKEKPREFFLGLSRFGPWFPIALQRLIEQVSKRPCLGRLEAPFRTGHAPG